MSDHTYCIPSPSGGKKGRKEETNAGEGGERLEKDSVGMTYRFLKFFFPLLPTSRYVAEQRTII